MPGQTQRRLLSSGIDEVVLGITPAWKRGAPGSRNQVVKATLHVGVPRYRDSTEEDALGNPLASMLPRREEGDLYRIHQALSGIFGEGYWGLFTTNNTPAPNHLIQAATMARYFDMAADIDDRITDPSIRSKVKIIGVGHLDNRTEVDSPLLENLYRGRRVTLPYAEDDPTTVSWSTRSA